MQGLAQHSDHSCVHIQRLDLRAHTDIPRTQLRAMMPRPMVSLAAVADQIAPVLEDISQQGVAAVRKYTREFDHVELTAVRVPSSQLKQALDQLDPQLKDALENAIARVQAVHQDQLPSTTTTSFTAGARVTQRWIPIERVGLYVPGGRAVYPSTVIMNVVPALIAGVDSLVIASPPHSAYGGLPHPTILATAALLGVHEVWAVGGAVAVGLFAYGGTDTDQQPLEPVDLITGPGNIYVAAAKRCVRDIVGVDTEAGPTEIAILADDGADPHFIAADMISQAEHDPLAAAILVTPSVDLADAVEREINCSVTAYSHGERIITALSGPQSSIILVSDLDQGIATINAYASEHVEIHTHNAQQVASRITNAGAVFVGAYSPVPLGDYAAGSNHVLPTSGTARYQSGLSVHSFLRCVSYIDYDRDALADIAPTVISLAEAEDLPAHGHAIRIRITDEEDTLR